MCNNKRSLKKEREFQRYRLREVDGVYVRNLRKILDYFVLMLMGIYILILCMNWDTFFVFGTNEHSWLTYPRFKDNHSNFYALGVGLFLFSTPCPSFSFPFPFSKDSMQLNCTVRSGEG